MKGGKTTKDRRKRRIAEGKDWRSRRRAEADSEPTKKPRNDGDTATRYHTDPLRGDKIAHGIAKKLRREWPPRTIAKMYGVPLDRVREIARLIGQ